ncbi:hypothetical protein NN561_007202 [Cricetulus griseus]
MIGGWPGQREAACPCPGSLRLPREGGRGRGWGAAQRPPPGAARTGGGGSQPDPRRGTLGCSVSARVRSRPGYNGLQAERGRQDGGARRGKDGRARGSPTRVMAARGGGPYIGAGPATRAGAGRRRGR